VFGTVASPRLPARKGILALRHTHPTTLIGGSRLNNAARKVSGHRRFRDGGRHLARPRRDPDNPCDHTVRAYDIDPELVPIFDEALRRLGR